MNKEIFVQNVKAYCAQRGIKPTVACRESGAGVNLISQLEKRGTIPSVERVQMRPAPGADPTRERRPKKNRDSGAVSDAEAALDQEIISRLVQLTPEELEKVDAFVQGLLAAR